MVSCIKCRASLEHKVIYIMERLGQGASALRDLDGIFDSSVTKCCDRGDVQLHAWKKSVEDEIAEVPSFTSFL